MSDRICNENQMKNRALANIENYLTALKEGSTDTLLREAEEGMEGMLVLNGAGHDPVFVGKPPRWDENPYGVGGYTWTISRLKYMTTLCKAFLLTKEQRYLDKVETDLWDWFEKEPAPPIPTDYESAVYYHGIHNWRMLEVGHRMLYTFPVLLDVLSVYSKDTALVERIKVSIAEHAERIAAGSHLLWPEKNHNHFMEEIDGMLSAVSMIQEHPKASEWLDTAIEEMEVSCANQMTEDGAQNEGAGEYHSLVIIDLFYAIHSANLCGRKFSPKFESLVRKGVDYAVHTISPDGKEIAYGDSDIYSTSPIQAVIFDFLVFRNFKAITTLRKFVGAEKILDVLINTYPWGFENVSELIAWLKAPLALEEDDMLLETSTYQRQMDAYIVRSSWEKDAACLFFSCHSPIHTGYHAHMDQLGIVFGAYGKVFLQDPGRYTYKDCEDRHLYKSSQVHNMPTINGEDAFEYHATFVYGPQKEGSITGIMDTERIQGVKGTHNNYEPVIISRSAALIDNRFLLIADTFEHVKGQNMKVFFHLDSTNVTIQDNEVYTNDEGANLYITTSLAKEEVHTEIMDGRLSDYFYSEYPSKRVAYSHMAEQDVETIFFLAIPFREEGEVLPHDIKEENGILEFTLNDILYRIRFEDGIFTIL